MSIVPNIPSDPVRRAPFHLSAALVILTGLTACDNVSWGGIELHLKSPPAPESEEASGGEEEFVPPEPEETGPLLFLIERTSEPPGFAAMPVAELEARGLRALPGAAPEDTTDRRIGEDAFRPGRRLILFAGGTRVGSLVFGNEVTTDTISCFPRPRVEGHGELVPDAVEVERFLALPEELGAGITHAPYRPAASTREERIAALEIAGSLVDRLAPEPPPSLVASRADLRVLALEEEGPSVVASTHVFRDRLRIEPAPPTAWSLFFLAERSEDETYRSTFSRLRTVGEEGKEVPRVVDHLDWNRDGSHELLLEILGEDARRFAALTRLGERWSWSLDETCPEPEGEGERVSLER